MRSRPAHLPIHTSFDSESYERHRSSSAEAVNARVRTQCRGQVSHYTVFNSMLCRGRIIQAMNLVFSSLSEYPSIASNITSILADRMTNPGDVIGVRILESAL